MQSGQFLSLSLSLLLLFSACQPAEQNSKTQTAPPSQSSTTVKTTSAQTSNRSGDITVPAGFKINIFAEGVGQARHLVVAPNGTVYVRLQSPKAGKCLVALRDNNGDGSADQQDYFGDSDCGTGLAIDQTHLYYSSKESVWRVPLNPEQAVPTAPAEQIIKELGQPAMHDARSLTLDGQGQIYVNLGAPSNACQQADRQRGSAGMDPCPLLAEFGGIYRFAIDRSQQSKSQGLRYASGIRNAVAIDWNTQVNDLYLVQHGRDQLHSLYPNLYTEKQSAELPAEEFARIKQGGNLGWPYCYYDPEQKKKVLAPEYGGDGKTIGRCANFEQPLIGFPAHYAPNDLLFYTGSQFPETYKNGAFIAFHGSWNRAPLEQDGYNVVFVPLQNGIPSGEWQVFADGFEGPTAVSSPGAAAFRPVGLAQTPDGDLLIVDSTQGRIWRVSKISS